MTEFEKKHPDTVALLKRLGVPSSTPTSVPARKPQAQPTPTPAPAPVRKPESKTEPTPTGYKGVLLLVWLLGILFVAVPFFRSLDFEPDGSSVVWMKMP